MQINIVLFALTLTELYLHTLRRDLLGGLALGCATAIKVMPGLLIPYLLYRRHFRAAACAAGAAMLFSLSPILVFGWMAGCAVHGRHNHMNPIAVVIERVPVGSRIPGVAFRTADGNPKGRNHNRKKGVVKAGLAGYGCLLDKASLIMPVLKPLGLRHLSKVLGLDKGTGMCSRDNTRLNVTGCCCEP